MKTIATVIVNSRKQKGYHLFNGIVSDLIWKQMSNVLKLNQVIHL